MIFAQLAEGAREEEPVGEGSLLHVSRGLEALRLVVLLLEGLGPELGRCGERESAERDGDETSQCVSCGGVWRRWHCFV